MLTFLKPWLSYLSLLLVGAFMVYLALRPTPVPPPANPRLQQLSGEIDSLKQAAAHFETVSRHLQLEINELRKDDRQLQQRYEALNLKQQQRKPQYETSTNRINALSRDSLYAAIEGFRPE
jgi:chromosome segregation ATPase